MKSHYFLIRKEGAVSYLEENMMATVFHGDLRVIISYNRHGREQRKVLQVTCDANVQADFLVAMKREKIQRLPPSYISLKLTTDHLARVEELRRLEINHMKQVCLQWRRPAGASGLRATREHFATLVVKAEKIVHGGQTGHGPEKRIQTQGSRQPEQQKRPRLDQKDRQNDTRANSGIDTVLRRTGARKGWF